MLKTLKFVLVLLVTLGCRREYAHFQSTSVENMHRPKRQTAKPIATRESLTERDLAEMEPLPMPDYEDISAGVETGMPSGKNQVNEKTDLFPKWLFNKRKKTSDSKKGGLFQKQENKSIFKKEKPKKRRNGIRHRSIVRLEIGAVLLGIAVVFALLHISILAIIFGLLSAFMIIRGLRKVL